MPIMQGCGSASEIPDLKGKKKKKSFFAGVRQGPTWRFWGADGAERRKKKGGEVDQFSRKAT